ncbi:hypothetical protein A2U01_0072454, partial [Trifolium medium]|nr:hypothetical protein [Trifolium medium]
DALKDEVAQLTGKLDKALELFANIGQPAQPTVVEPPVLTTLTSQAGSSAQNIAWPLYGLPIGYTPPGYIPIEVQQAPHNTQAPPNQVETLNTQPRVSSV